MADGLLELKLQNLGYGTEINEFKSELKKRSKSCEGEGRGAPLGPVLLLRLEAE
jgi:hypothetical protein